MTREVRAQQPFVFFFFLWNVCRSIEKEFVLLEHLFLFNCFRGKKNQAKLHVVSRGLRIATKSQNCIINLLPGQEILEKTTSLIIANDKKRKKRNDQQLKMTCQLAKLQFRYKDYLCRLLYQRSVGDFKCDSLLAERMKLTELSISRRERDTYYG